ncbi:hypothetical protein GCM10009789_32610 [Kribbella sancticallisti]|uniref:Secreted protein n=1 Tax=Kribbella sancticallisti TaxID=460087 RepID=A0ABN2DIV7_9ACTN
MACAAVRVLSFTAGATGAFDSVVFGAPVADGASSAKGSVSALSGCPPQPARAKEQMKTSDTQRMNSPRS